MIGGMKKDMLRNSLLYIKRKKKKSIIVLFILTAILISLVIMWRVLFIEQPILHLF